MSLFRILTLLLLLVVADGYAQLPGMRKYTQLEGFTATNGYLINQDEQGYLWIGTDNGGLGFDGNTFTPLQQFPGGGYVEVTSCAPVSHNRVILCPMSGTPLVSDKRSTPVAVKKDTGDTGRVPNHNYSRKDPVTGAWWIYDAVVDMEQCVLMGRYQKNSVQWQTLKEPGFVPFLFLDNCLIGTKGPALHMYELKSGRSHALRHSDGSLIDYKIEWPADITMTLGYLPMWDKKNKRINVYHYSAGDSFITLTHSFPAPFASMTTYSCLSAGQKEYMLLKDVSSDSIAYCPDVAAAGLQWIKFKGQGNVNSPFVDRNNNLWITSSNNALYFLSEKHIKNAFACTRFPSGAKVPKSISGHNGTLCLSYANSRDVILIRDGKTKTITLNHHFVEGSRNIIPVNEAEFLVYNKGLALIDQNTGRVSYFNSAIAAYKDVCRYREEEFLGAMHGGIVHIYRSGKGEYISEPVFNGRTSAVEVLGDGQILIGTPEGLYIKKELHSPAVKLPRPLSGHIYITDIVPLTRQHALIGTNGSGLLLYKNDNTIQELKLHDDNILPSIRQLFRENDSTVWAATNMGGSRISFDGSGSIKGIRHYTFYEGLPSNNVTSVFVEKDTAFFATAEGWGAIPVRDSSILHMAPPVLSFNWLRAGDSSYMDPGKKIILPYDHNNLRVSLSGISYESQGNVTYFYRLSPLQQEWIATTDPEIRLNNTDPGEYIFEAYATNAKGTSSNLLKLRIYVKSAFWQTIYFKAAVLLLIITGVYFLVKWRIQKTERAKYRAEAQKKHLAQLELEAIKAQINPHFIHNCLNSIQYLNYKEDYASAQRYLGLFAQLIRKTMKYAQRTFISVAEETEYLSQYLQLEKLRFKEKFDYRIDIEDSVRKDTQLPAMLLQPYVENALKHGIANKTEGGTVTLQFSKKGPVLQVLIKDNGAGFPGSVKEETLGLRISGSRAQSYNDLFGLDICVNRYNIQDKYPEQTGAIVEINIDTSKYGTRT